MEQVLSSDKRASAAGDRPVPRCAGCLHRPDDRQAVERSLPGLIVFGSAYGASMGTSRLCLLHDRLVSPDDACTRFSAIEA